MPEPARNLAEPEAGGNRGFEATWCMAAARPRMIEPTLAHASVDEERTSARSDATHELCH